MVKWRKMWLAEQLSRRGAYRISMEKLRESDHLKDVAVDGKIILKCIFKK
jgi:hypothetical protein